MEDVIEALQKDQTELGEPREQDSESSPCRIVARTLTYLTNYKDQMRYNEFRQQGFPITSSYVESAVKQINHGVKGTEKFWNENGAESILQLRADHVSDNQPMQEFWQRRQERNRAEPVSSDGVRRSRSCARQGDVPKSRGCGPR